MSNAIIAYDNLAEQALSITSSSARTGFAAASAFDWRTTTYWSPNSTAATHTLTVALPTAQPADYFAFYRHNLASCAATIKLQYSTNSGSTWSNASATITPADNDCTLHLMTTRTATHWRIVVVTGNTTPCYLGIVAFGSRLTTYRGMPPGFVVPRHARKNKFLNSTTEGGQWAGRSLVARGAATTIEMRHVDRDWVRSDWEPFLRHAELKPFFFSWNHTAYPGDTVFAWLDGELPEMPVDGDFLHQLRLPVRCLLSGDF